VFPSFSDTKAKDESTEASDNLDQTEDTTTPNVDDEKLELPASSDSGIF